MWISVPSIYLIREGRAKRVTFQDYNESVLRTTTIPNIVSNVQGIATEMSNFTFMHGDWHAISVGYTLKESFDLILSSETIYNPSSYLPLCRIIRDTLAKDGIALIAAKEYYFGSTLGGCMAGFEGAATSFGFSCERVWQSSDNGLNRVILKIQFK